MSALESSTQEQDNLENVLEKLAFIGQEESYQDFRDFLIIRGLYNQDVIWGEMAENFAEINQAFSALFFEVLGDLAQYKSSIIELKEKVDCPVILIQAEPTIDDIQWMKRHGVTYVEAIDNYPQINALFNDREGVIFKYRHGEQPYQENWMDVLQTGFVGLMNLGVLIALLFFVQGWLKFSVETEQAELLISGALSLISVLLFVATFSAKSAANSAMAKIRSRVTPMLFALTAAGVFFVGAAMLLMVSLLAGIAMAGIALVFAKDLIFPSSNGFGAGFNLVIVVITSSLSWLFTSVGMTLFV